MTNKKLGVLAIITLVITVVVAGVAIYQAVQISKMNKEMGGSSDSDEGTDSPAIANKDLMIEEGA